MILIVDDDKSIRLSLGLLLKKAGYNVAYAPDPASAIDAVRAQPMQLILMDMNYGSSTSGQEGLELLAKTRVFQPDTPVILITAWGSIDLAVQGVKAGAYDFITKPWSNHALLQRIATAISLKSQPALTDADFDRAGIIGNDPKLLDLLDTARRIAPTDAPVLILGENGTGKEMIANAIHLNSLRAKNPFIMVNLGGIPQSLFESEMFGYAKGAFTGAVAQRIGRFEMADTGTIFLDEIGDLDLACQVKLLRVLQQHTFEPLGDSRPKKVDIRVICATNADLPAMVAERTFREDLFYRINLITLRLPALRERPGDIPLLVRHFIRQASLHSGSVPEISPDAMEYLTRLPYPGNIRQLKNIVDRAVLVGGPRLEKEDFAPSADMPSACSPTPAGDHADTHSAPTPPLRSLEQAAIQNALDKCGGNLSQAARMLKITRQALYRRMEKYGMK
ncbi:MAG: sigma-54 dependent transcriptional regulator [Clostridium sp.]|nr:sigma-54 dependent transcriptional regulator [Clostridium sp.]